MDQQIYDYDFIVIGSGFGGSVSALRLAEKGYRVAILEKGKRWRKEDFPKTNWAKNYLWMPQFGMYGYQNLTILKHVGILHGGGVGGGDGGSGLARGYRRDTTTQHKRQTVSTPHPGLHSCSR